MTTLSQTLAIAAIVVGLLAVWQVAAGATGVTPVAASLSAGSATVSMAGDDGRVSGAYTSGNDRATAQYVPVSQLGNWIDRARHGNMNHSDKNKGWIGGGLLILLL